MVMININEFVHLNNIIVDMYPYVKSVDINNNEINIIYKPDNKFGIVRQVARYENEDLKNLLKKIMKLLDKEN